MLGNLFSRCINITPIPKRSWQYFFKYSLPLSQKKIPVGLYLRRCLQAIFFAKLPTTKDKHHVTTPSLRFFLEKFCLYVCLSFFLFICLSLSVIVPNETVLVSVGPGFVYTMYIIHIIYNIYTISFVYS